MEERVTEFLSYLTVEKGSSKHTLASYKKDLQQFSKTLKDKSVFDVSRADISHYLAKLSQKFSATSVARKISALKSFFHFLLR